MSTSILEALPSKLDLISKDTHLVCADQLFVAKYWCKYPMDCSFFKNVHYMCGSRWGTGGPDPHPLKNHLNIAFLSNTGPDPLKNHKATKPFKRRFAGGPMMALIVVVGSSQQLKIRCQNWTRSGKNFWIRACTINNISGIFTKLTGKQFFFCGTNFLYSL